MLIRYGGPVAAGSGSAGGNTYSRNRYGAYIRARTKPVNPNSPRQQVVRNNLCWLVEQWSANLTDMQRQLWNVYGYSVAWVNKLGERVYIPGFNHFLRSNCAILQCGGQLVKDAPTKLSLPGTDPLFAPTVDASDKKISVVFDDTQSWCGEDGGYMAVHATLPSGPQLFYLKQRSRFAGYIEGKATGSPTSPVEIDFPWECAAEQQTIITARIIRKDGRVSAPFRKSVTIVA